MEEAERAPPGCFRLGCSGLPPTEGFGRMVSILYGLSRTFLLFQPSYQPAHRLCKVIPYEIELLIRWGFPHYLQALTKPRKIDFCRKPIEVGRGEGKKKNCIPMEPKTMASLNVIKSIIKWIWSVNCVSTLNGLMIWEFIQNCCVDFMLMAVWI